MFRNARTILVAALALAACGTATQPLVTNGDITRYMEGKGYSKILLREDFSCGRAGRGKHFVATRDKKVRTGQLCYLKNGKDVTYSIDELGTVRPGATPTPRSHKDFWREPRIYNQ